MRRRQRKYDEDDRIGLHGWAKFFNSLARLILYPLFSPLSFSLIVVVVCGILASPMLLFGISKDELPDWYRAQYATINEKITTYWSDMQIAYGHKNLPQQEKENTYPEEITQKSVTAEDIQTFAESMSAKDLRQNGRENPYYVTNSKFNLSYLPEIMELHGTADVYSPNEISVDGVYIFLYGIYTDKNSSNYAYANEYLREKIQGKNIRCDIVAYTERKVATAVCYDGTDNINKMMVKTHLAKQVSE